METAETYLVSRTSKPSPGGFSTTHPRVSSSPPSQQFFICLIPPLTRALQPQELFWEGNFLSKMKDLAGIRLSSLAAGLSAGWGQKHNPLPRHSLGTQGHHGGHATTLGGAR